MTLIEFKGGTDPEQPYRVFICPDMVVTVSSTTSYQIQNITMENAQVQTVQGSLDDIVHALSTAP
jgi:hypothetical protein